MTKPTPTGPRFAISAIAMSALCSCQVAGLIAATEEPFAAPDAESSVLSSITIVPPAATVESGTTQGFSAITEDQYGNAIAAEIIWESSNTAVGTIDATGLFSALEQGTTEVSAANDIVRDTVVVTVTNDTSAGAPGPGPLPASCTYLLSTTNSVVNATNRSTGTVEYSGTFNQVLSRTGGSGNHVCIQNGNYSLSTISDLQSNVIIECESNAIIKGTTTSAVPYLIYLKSDTTVKNCTFDHSRKTIFASGNISNWHVENNYFINSAIAVLVENLETGSGFPASGYGYIMDNKGLHSKLTTMEGTRNITVRGNTFSDRNGPEFVDFNYNVHYVILENNTFINGSGYSISEEVIDMIGGNSYSNSNNIVRNNTIISNFRSGIRPAKSASNNIIENNHIEFKPGRATNIAGVYLYGGGSAFSTPKNNQIVNNTIIGGTAGIELSGANDNTVDGNTISGSVRGINLVRDSFYGSDVAPENNTVTNNTIDNTDYGIYIESSPNNFVNNNDITNARIANTFSK